MNLTPLALWLFSFLVGYLVWDMRTGLITLAAAVGFSLTVTLLDKR